MTNKLLYDHFRNIKLLELYKGQNYLIHPSLNYGYDQLDITKNFVLSEPKFESLEYYYGNEGFLTSIKDVAVKF